MTWPTATLGDVSELHYGRALEGYHSEPDGESVARVFGTNGPIGWAKSALTDSPTIIVGRKGAYRGVHFSDGPSWTIDTAYYTEIRSDLVDLKWFYYRLLLLDINALNSGAAIPSTRREDFYTLRIALPGIDSQRRISQVLSAYDDLIEINRRRIALLEEAARLLYQEWFIHFRFPGHEHRKVVNGLPSGWDIRLLSELCRLGDGIQTGPFGSQLHQSDYAEVGVPVVMPKDIQGFRIQTEGVARIPEFLADRLGRHRMEVGDTVYGRRGDIGRRAFIGRRQVGWLCGTGCLRIRPDPNKIVPRYLFETLGSQQTAGFIANQAKGSTMPNLSAGSLQKVPILYPPLSVQKLFAGEIEPTIEFSEILTEQNKKLAQARDLLLPRLMSGEIAA